MLQESPKSDFKQMFQFLDPKENVETLGIAKENFDWAYKTFQTNGKPNSAQILWYMRYVRLFILSHLAGAVPEYQSVFDKEKTKMSNKMGEDGGELVSVAKQMVLSNWFKNKIEHFKSLELENIDTLEFGWNPSQKILDAMETIEERWKENARFNISLDQYDRSDDHHMGKPEKLIDFGDGFAWWDLARPSCSIEGNAMGHCGNSPRSYSDDTVLSLRKEVQQKGKTYYQPYLTFILQSDGTLGEMKGRFNEKPQSEFHPYIVALLKHDAIKGIEGGGYLAQNNFSMNDLDDDEREELEDEKPELKSALAGFREKEFADITQDDLDKIYEKMREKNIAPYEMQKEENRIVLETFGDVETFCNDKFEYHHPVHKLFKILNDPEDISEITDFEAEDLDDQYFVELIRRLPNWYQDKIFAEGDSTDPERALWKLQRERHRYWEYMVDAFNKAHVFQLDDEYKGDMEEYEGMTYRGAIERRIMKYVDYTPLNPYDLGAEITGLNDEVTLYLNDHHLLLDAYQAASDDEYAYEYFENGNIYDIMEHGWGYQENVDRYSYNEVFGEHGHLDKPLIDDNDNDKLINEISGNAGSIKMIDALDAFERQFDMREEKEPADDMLKDIIRLAKI